MGNSFAIHGLRDEATHERRDVDIRQVGTGERPDKNELVKTKTPKPAEEGHIKLCIIRYIKHTAHEQNVTYVTLVA